MQRQNPAVRNRRPGAPIQGLPPQYSRGKVIENELIQYISPGIPGSCVSLPPGAPWPSIVPGVAGSSITLVGSGSCFEGDGEGVGS